MTMTGQDAKRAEELWMILATATSDTQAADMIQQAIDAAVAEAHKERDRLYMEMGKTIARQVAEAVKELNEKIAVMEPSFRNYHRDIAEARREEREKCLRELWTRRCLPLCEHPECTRVKVIEEAIRRLAAEGPGPGGAE